ncbi:MAG: N-acetylglucosamine kinase [Clostridium sp.]|uniref:N-acetylglucosamine kinase n=1 Tax=Clostridium sp. TaxID=1506 RepID=UPI003D6CA81D
MNYIIGVDGGGTKTEAVAYSLEGKELGKGRSGFGNLLLNFKQALKNIINAVELCKDGINEYGGNLDCLCIYVGLAGLETIGYKEKIENVLKEKFNCKVEVCNDAEIAHAALLKGKDGIMTISGTGSICYGLYKGKRDRTGGWGHILGDKGSGYYIALEAFKKMAFEEDSGLEKSKLTLAIMSKLNIDNVNDIKEFIHSENKGEIASYAQLVVELANIFEVNSVNILRKAGEDLAIMTERLYKKLEINEPINIGVKGSILTEVSLVREEFSNYLQAKLSDVTIIMEDISPTKGACYLHKAIMK